MGRKVRWTERGERNKEERREEKRETEGERKERQRTQEIMFPEASIL